MIDALWTLALRQALLLSIAIILLRAARPMLLRQGPGFTYAAWWLVPAMLLTPLLPQPANAVVTRFSVDVLGPLASLAGQDGLPQAPLPADDAQHHRWWMLVWLVGTATALLVQALRQWRVARLGTTLPAGSSPALIGLLRPRLALPADFDSRFSREERELILVHEAVHQARLDNLWNLISAVLLAMHWWNPLAWWAARRLQADQELACDQAVVGAMPERLPVYVQALLAAHHLPTHTAPVASRWASAHPLVDRIAMLKHTPASSRTRKSLMAAGLAACAGLCWTSQAASLSNPAGPELKLSLVISQQVGERVNRLQLALAGRDGQTMHLDHPGDGSDANPPMALDLTAHVVAPGRVRIDAVMWEGRPLAVVSRPVMLMPLDEPGLIENVDAARGTRTSLVVVPSVVKLP
ncbi:M56 family metallopeptidase [Ideonella margarita]|uniref:M56 family metallopeptidase n=1 Tax=Ideonella margarita TaxID=2984191 RepID=A0ABU9C6B0_9BURK